jgi:hypothetical protein
LGTATGGAAVAFNFWIAKKSLPIGTKVVVMIGVVVASYVIYFAFAPLWYTFTHQPTASPV